jgi:hypothetical protein
MRSITADAVPLFGLDRRATRAHQGIPVHPSLYPVSLNGWREDFSPFCVDRGGRLRHQIRAAGGIRYLVVNVAPESAPHGVAEAAPESSKLWARNAFLAAVKAAADFAPPAMAST